MKTRPKYILISFRVSTNTGGFYQFNHHLGFIKEYNEEILILDAVLKDVDSVFDFIWLLSRSTLTAKGASMFNGRIAKAEFDMCIQFKMIGIIPDQ